MHPSICNRLRGELARVTEALRKERARPNPDPRRLSELNGQRTWLTDALWQAEMARSCARWPGAAPLYLDDGTADR